jgi:hypothetical protein
MTHDIKRWLATPHNSSLLPPVINKDQQSAPIGERARIDRIDCANRERSGCTCVSWLFAATTQGALGEKTALFGVWRTFGNIDAVLQCSCGN